MTDNLAHARSLIEALGLTASDTAGRCPGCLTIYTALLAPGPSITSRHRHVVKP